MASPSTTGLHPGAAASSKSLDDEKLTVVAELRAATGSKPDAGVLVAALYANKQPPIIEYVCTQLARCDVRDLEFFVPQLCNLMIYRKDAARSLERLLTDLCSRSLHFGLLVHYHFQAAIADSTDVVDDCRDLITKFYSAAVSSSRDTIMTQTIRQYAVFQMDALKKRLSQQLSPVGSPIERRASVTIGGPADGNRSPPHSPSVSESEPTNNPNSYNFALSSTSSTNSGAQLSASGVSSPSSVDLAEDASQESQVFTASQYHALKRQFFNRSHASADAFAFNPVLEKSLSSRMDQILRPRTSTTDFNRMSSAAAAVVKAIEANSDNLSEAISTMEHHAQRTRSVSAFPATDEAESVAIGFNRRIPNPNVSQSLLVASEADILLRRYRHEFFHAQIDFLYSLGGISNLLKSMNFGTKQAKTAALRVCLQQLNLEFSRGVYHIYNGICHRIIRIPWKESFTLNSREKVPYMLFIEVVAPEKEEKRATVDDLIKSSSSLSAASLSALKPAETVSQGDTSEPKVTQIGQLNIIDEWVVVENQENPESKQQSIIDKVFGEPWAKKKERVRRSSPVGNQKGWDLLSMIMKAGDDLRQEQLAMQLITVCHEIFISGGLPLWLKPYEVMPTSADGGYIETVHDAISLHSLKEVLADDPSLRSYFIRAYGDKTREFLEAQRNFIESLAAYSLICYLLQIKDRHNGNILIDRAGHLIHIDYGFMLTSSPGSLNFETAPFKLTIEFVEVMGGRNNAMFQYFKDLVGFGFLKLRENAKRIISLVEMMLPATKMACFAKGPGTIKELEDRFQLKLSRDEAIAFAENLIEQSIGNWRTDSYDTYQRYFSGIAT